MADRLSEIRELKKKWLAQREIAQMESSQTEPVSSAHILADIITSSSIDIPVSSKKTESYKSPSEDRYFSSTSLKTHPNPSTFDHQSLSALHESMHEEFKLSSFECPICYKPMNREDGRSPLSLTPCGHPVCSDCFLQLKLHSTQSKSPSSLFPCPLCRGAVKGAVRNLALESVIDEVLHSSKVSKEEIEEEERRKKAQMYDKAHSSLSKRIALLQKEIDKTREDNVDVSELKSSYQTAHKSIVEKIETLDEEIEKLCSKREELGDVLSELEEEYKVSFAKSEQSEKKLKIMSETLSLLEKEERKLKYLSQGFQKRSGE
ncbi:E3 ubiquitin-protein ligase Rad18 like protein [Aduncisulcus paluster]|uniref:E3 ubiquitin-protein ligase Rad18 like protein n=1 Tax=Aduncisulcus paluster TaxID=2918883 RepID=A0ABQ5KMX3_9EUKA|nr:E3 ubiquitin-protein ligase Rad18 like protein [Aduncisulcus paluster]